MPEEKWKLSRVLAPGRIECPKCQAQAKLRVEERDEAAYACYECGNRFVMARCQGTPDGGEDAIIEGSQVPLKKFKPKSSP